MSHTVPVWHAKFTINLSWCTQKAHKRIFRSEENAHQVYGHLFRSDTWMYSEQGCKDDGRNNSRTNGWETDWSLDSVGFKIRSYRPARFETVKSFAERLLLSLLNYLPVGIPEVHIVAHRYNGLFGKLTDTGELISLKLACRFRQGKGKNLQISTLSTIEE